MGSYTNEATAQHSKSITPKTEVIEALQLFDLALCECIAITTPGGEADAAQLAEHFAQLRRCMEEMRFGVGQVQAVVQREWPEQ